MRRAAYTNDISKPPIVLRVLGSIVKWTLIALLAGLVAAAAYFVVRGYALYNNAAQEKSVADMVTDIESRAGFTPLEAVSYTHLDVYKRQAYRRKDGGSLPISQQTSRKSYLPRSTPVSKPYATSAARLSQCAFAVMFAKWTFTVCSERAKRAAIPLLERPRAI